MRIIEDFLDFFENQNVAWRDSVSFQVLFLAQDYDINEHPYNSDDFQGLKNYLIMDIEVEKKIGKLIYLIGAIDFTVDDYDNIDSLIDSQIMMKKVIEKGKSEGRDMTNLSAIHSMGNIKFEERKKFKKEWLDYRDTKLNYELLNQALRLSLLDRN